MNNFKLWSVGLLVVGLLLISGFFILNNQKKVEPASQKQEEVNQVSTTIIVDSDIKKVKVKEGTTALEATKKSVGGKVELDNSGMVASINGLKADSSKNEYWEFVINGETAKVGAGSYTVENGDTIEWRISKF